MLSDNEVAVFMEELDEKIQILNDNILDMEKNGGSPEVLNEIFRAAHTIKGSSAVMGYEKMSTLTHEIENLFDRLRQQNMDISVSLIDTLFEALDTINALRDEITGDGGKVDTGPLVSKIRQFQEETTPGGEEEQGQQKQEEKSSNVEVAAGLPPLEEVDVSLVQEGELKGYQAFWVTTTVQEGTQMPEVRAYLVFETLQQLGEVIKSVPATEEIQEGKFEGSFTVILLTQEDADNIRNQILSIAEIQDADIQRVEIREKEEKEDQKEEQGAEEEEKGQQEEKQQATPQAQQAQNGEKKSTTTKTVRVDVQKLDTLMNLVGELVIDRTRLDRFVQDFEGQHGSDDLSDNLMEISRHLGQVSSELQDEIMKARMLPISHVFNRLPRMVRDISHKMGKEVDFNIEGKETELDRNVIEVLGDPLIHLLRNSIDHGIERPDEREKLGKPRAGKLNLKAAYVESHIVITLEDDGKGLDSDKIKEKVLEKGLASRDQLDRLGEKEILEYIFNPGFSTTDEVSDVSGRGVGMDVVRNQIEQINGSVDFETVRGEGTTFTIKLPLTLAIISALMVRLGEHIYAFPLTNIAETLAITQEDIRLVRHSEVTVVRGSVLPLVRLSDVFNQPSRLGEGDKLHVVVLGIGDRRVGVIVDHLEGEQEIVIKSLGSHLGQVEGISGATILGDGKVALIIDARGIIKQAGAGLEDASYAAAIN